LSSAREERCHAATVKLEDHVERPEDVAELLALHQDTDLLDRQIVGIRQEPERGWGPAGPEPVIQAATGASMSGAATGAAASSYPSGSLFAATITAPISMVGAVNLDRKVDHAV
jgi:hypothetical protein